MFPNKNVAYKVTLPDGATFYAAGIHVFDPKDAVPAEDLPAGVFWYLMSSNTILGGYSFRATRCATSEQNTDRMQARLYVPSAKAYAPRPVTFQVAGRDQVEGDYHAPGDFTAADLDDAELIQNILVASLVLPVSDALREDKQARGYVWLNP